MDQTPHHAPPKAKVTRSNRVGCASRGPLFCPLRFQRARRGEFKRSSLKGAAAAEVHRAACLSQGTRDRTGVTRLTLTATIAEILLGGEPPSSGHDPARAVVGAKSVTIFSAMDRVEEPAWSLRRLWFDRRPMHC